jgi:phenylpropionate dioxygenase-like ring-hydroxylating dioxygenase large terminal subunit
MSGPSDANTRMPSGAVGETAWRDDATGPVVLSVDCYLDPDHARREGERLWPRVWQFACTLDHLPRPGSYHEYTSGPLSVLIVHGDDGTLRAFQNVCRHRGNSLCRGSGDGLDEIRCGYHRWAWNLRGELREVPSRRGFGPLRNEDYPLLPVRVDTWGPLVFVNLDADAPTLGDYLEGVPDDARWADLDEFRCSLTTSTPLSCNWKIVSEGFSETYHVQGLHPELLATVDDVHAPQRIWDHHGASYQLYGVPSPRIRTTVTDAEVWDAFADTQRLRLGTGEPLPPLAEGETVADAIARQIRAHQASRGVDLGRFSDSQINTISQYNLFPNTSVLVSADSLLVLSARPGADVADCVLFTANFERAPDPEVERTQPKEIVNTRDEARALGTVFNQDLSVAVSMQKGLRQPGLTHINLSSEEIRVINAHRVLDRYLSDQPGHRS